MSIILSIYSMKAFKEYLLPSANNTEYVIVLDKNIFHLEKDVELKLEVIEGCWSFMRTNEFRLEDIAEKKNYFECHLKNDDMLLITLANREVLSVMVKETESSFSVFEKYDIRNKEQVTIGRNETNDIQYNRYNLISQEHAAILKNGNQFILHDRALENKKTNGVFVNSIRVAGQKQLTFGDCISIFGLCIVFLNGIIAVNVHEKNVQIRKDGLVKYEESGEGRSPIKIEQKQKILYHRSPRQIYKFTGDPFEIEAPPQPKEINRKPLGMLLGPSLTMALPMLLGCLMSIYGSNINGNGSSAFMYTGLVTAISSAAIGTVWSLVNLRFENKKNRQEEVRRFEAYGEYLIKCTNRIKEKYNKNTENMRAMYFSAEECSRMDEHTGFLWNRNAEHDDFLFHRLGTGNIPFQVEIEIPRERFTLINDSLSEKPGMIRDSYKILYDVPICIDLAAHRIVGIVGGEKKLGGSEAVRNLIAQIATSNCYTDVKLAFIYDETKDENCNWEYFRWLPHVWSEDKKIRYIAKNKLEAGDIFYEITKALRIRSENNKIQNKSKKLIKPQYILFISDPELLTGELIGRYLFDGEQDYGVTAVILANNYEELPNECDYIIQNDASFQGMYGISDDREERIQIQFDSISDEQMEKLARKLSDIEVNENETGGDIPSSLTFFDMYQVNRLEDLQAQERWRKNRTYDSMKALIGEKAGGTPWYLDVHEKYHGPHGLIAGTTGSGKSETLQTYILSLALNFSPDDVGFFLIDYKGGGMAKLFDGLPHIIGQISNLSGNQVRRAMVAIKSENRRRQQIFNEHGVNNINLYTRMYKNNEAAEPVPHMFIIIDEFAQLKMEEPEFMRELISVAQVGRSLGVHLILATQKPSGTVDDNIWSNAKFRLCLRVQDRQDSNEMLHRPDAAYITQAGRCFMQVGNDELFELFQSGWSGAVYDENGNHQKQATVQMLSLDGKAALIGNRSKVMQKEKYKRQWIMGLLCVIKEIGTACQINLKELLNTSEKTKEVWKEIFAAFEKKDMDYPYSEADESKCKALVEACMAVCEKEPVLEDDLIVEKILEYADKRKWKLPEKKEKTQLDAVVEYLGKMARENGYTHSFALWLPVLPSCLYLNRLRTYENCFTGTEWKKERGEWNLEVPIGLYDDPSNQAQDVLTLNLSLNGHHAIVGTVVSGKSTFLQTFLYALITKYTPDDIHIYGIDFSAKMMSAFEGMPHVGGIIYENEEDKLAKFFHMMGQILEERKKLFRGGNYSQYVRANGIILPVIIIAIDNYANFNNKSKNKYEDIMLQLSKNGVNYGVYLIITGAGFGASEIPVKIGEGFRTTICLEMNDKYQYAEALRTGRVETLPESNIKGRGLARIGEDILEFQTALAFEAEDDFKRMEQMQGLGKRMAEAWKGRKAKPVPEIPDQPVWKEFAALDDVQKMSEDDRHLPIGYDTENAAVYSVDLSRIYCYLIGGKARCGKTNLLKILLCSSNMREGRRAIIDFNGEFSYLSEYVAFDMVDSDKKMFDFFKSLIPEFKERNQFKKECVKEGYSDEEIYLAMKKFQPIFIFIADFAEFVQHVMKPKDAGEMKAAVENLLHKGSLHNVFWFACYNYEDAVKAAGTEIYSHFLKYKTGIHFGGNVSGIHVMDFSHIPYAEQLQPLKPGIGLLSSGEEQTKKVVVPLLKG